MTISQKRAIWYNERRKEELRREYYLFFKKLYDEFEASKYKSMLWFIKSKDLEKEYNAYCYYNHEELDEFIKECL